MPALDHLILFVPVNQTTKLPEVPTFFKENFTLSPGGFHADGATSNVLIILADGCYIELISFINPDAASTHWWGPDSHFIGWKDWCLTTTTGSAEANYQNVKTSHGEPIHGGRKRPDGVDVKWAVTFPLVDKGGQHARGRVPFFCHDLTPRDVRVPLGKEQTAHSSGVLGVRQLTVVVRDAAMLQETRDVYTSILGSSVRASGDEVVFQAERVQAIDGLRDRPKIVLRLPKDEEEKKQTETAGFVYGDVVLGAKAQGDKPVRTKERIDGAGKETSIGGLWIEFE